AGPAGTRTCRHFLADEIASLKRLRAVLALGRIAHDSVVAATGGRASQYRFAHGAVHALPGGLRLVDSYHCSRYNTQTGVLTPEMFRAAVATARRGSGTAPPAPASHPPQQTRVR